MQWQQELVYAVCWAVPLPIQITQTPRSLYDVQLGWYQTENTICSLQLKNTLQLTFKNMLQLTINNTQQFTIKNTPQHTIKKTLQLTINKSSASAEVADQNVTWYVL